MDAPILRVRGIRKPVDTTLVMGVVNASPESFSDAGRFLTLDSRLELAAGLIEAGADIIDIGGQSAITGRPELEAEEEAARVVPIVEWLRRNYADTIISVDTYKPTVTKAVLEVGADIINDVSGLRYPEVAQLCASENAALVVMHTAAPPKVRRQERHLYANVTQEVFDFLVSRSASAVDLGVDPEAIILDPGPDFAKTPHQTLQVLRDTDRFRALGRPILLALSRKDVLGAITGRTPQKRGPATDAAIAFYATQPGGIVRVHDVAAAVDVIATVESLAGRRDIPAEYLLPEAIRHEPPASR